MDALEWTIIGGIGVVGVVAFVANRNNNSDTGATVTDAVASGVAALGQDVTDAVSSVSPSGVSSDSSVLDYFNQIDAANIDAVNNASATYGVPTSIINAVINQESGWNPNAVSKTNAQGLMQLEPPTAASLGVTDPFDPVQNINGGTKYLAQLFQQFQDWGLALAAYNWGPGNVAKNGYNNWPAETQAYVPTVLKNAGM